MQTPVRVLLLAALAAAAIGCKKEEAAPAPVVAPVVVAVPTTTDMESWKPYLTSVLKKHMDRRFKRPYMYFIPAAGGDEEQRQYDAQLESVQNAVGRGILAGSMLAFGGPDPGRTAQVVVDSFKLAGAKSLKGVRVVYIGTPDTQEVARTAVAPSEAEFIFEDMGVLPTYTTTAPATAPGEALPTDATAPADGSTPPADAAPAEEKAPDESKPEGSSGG